MASAASPTNPTPPTGQVNMETPISLRVSVHGVTKKFKLPLGDLNARVLPTKLRTLLDIPSTQAVTFERFSDSAGTYVTLDANNTHVYKTLFRAAKAKLKLRLRATFPGVPPFQPIALPGACASAFPEFNRFNASETALNTINTESTMAPQRGSTETLVPAVNAEASSSKAEAATSGDEAKPKMSREHFLNNIAHLSLQRELALRQKEVAPAATMCSWSVFCNNCDDPMADSHYHCNVCDNGDYDLCEDCVKSGVHCFREDHWLVKRFVKNGQVVSSTTERLSAKEPEVKVKKEEEPLEMPGAFTTEEKKSEEELDCVLEATRTCNCCVKEDEENCFVTCLDCPDFDLCIPCHEANNHGHHPAHKFKAVGEAVALSPLAEFLCAPGRNMKHSALCDGCDKPIFGIRHKCLNCPDWDYCSECVKNASFIHPGHRFAPLYEQISAPRYRKTRHVGIYCDGPLCENKHDYIEGTRYKCAICHDTDLCANCEAYPHNKHNHTHPLIQFKTPVRNATITTVHEDQYGRSLAPKGDRSAAKADSSKAPANAATQVQTIIDVNPTEPPVKSLKEKIEIKDLLAEPIEEKIKVQDLLSSPVQESKTPVDLDKLNAVFVTETIADGTVVRPEDDFSQIWTLRNPGPAYWPAGCSVRFTGGDNMLSGAESNVIVRPVAVGEEVSFRVCLKAPTVPGIKISYWRLKTADGQAFGHRLWCHVSVVPKSEPVPENAPLPIASMEPKQWKDNFLQQALQHRLERAQAIEKQRVELEKIKARHEAKQAAEAQAKASRAETLRRLSADISAVETQHKARIAAAKAAIDAARAAKAPVSAPQPQPATELPAPLPSMHPHALQDYQIQLMLLEQKEKKRELMAQQDGTPAPAPSVNFHEQLRLLEQQNKQRLLAARKEQEKADYETQLRLLEEQNKKRMVCNMPPVEVEAETRPVIAESSKATATREELKQFQEQLMLLEQHNVKRLSQCRRAVSAEPAPVEVEAEVRPVTVEDVVDEEEIKAKFGTVVKNAMIFPTLEKESPAASTADVSTTVSAGKSEVEVEVDVAQSQRSDEIFEDAESVTFVDDSDEETGFMTDEEYDILDASDEEIAA